MIEKTLKQDEIDALFEEARGSAPEIARNLTRNLAAWLRTRFPAGLVSAEPFQLNEFLLRIPETGYVVAVRLKNIPCLF